MEQVAKSRCDYNIFTTLTDAGFYMGLPGLHEH